ncbi:MAG TPA: globin domain-containing protein [Polyangiaceae bacterium]|nr:globin domain-containing protein [Polyangiaceae bacterium]
MSLNAVLLRQSFDAIVEREPALTRRFYDVLFSRFPQAKPLFGSASMDRQMEMLQSALVSVLDHLEDASWLASTLGALGRKHAGYGVTAEMYDWVGESLVTALAESAGPAWTTAMREAWADAYGAIARLMLAGAAESA